VDPLIQVFLVLLSLSITLIFLNLKAGASWLKLLTLTMLLGTLGAAMFIAVLLVMEVVPSA